MTDEKMNWIYQAPSDRVNREDYLLGKKVDKYVDPTLQAEEREKNLLSTTPGALFVDSAVNTTVDLENKIREDPLFEIRKREEEAKKRLANNPVKLKQLRALVDEVRSGGKKKKKKKHKHRGAESDESPEHKSHSKRETERNERQRHRSRSPDRYTHHHGYKGRPETYGNRPGRREETVPITKKLSREEIEQKRREMADNAKWHTGKREERVMKHRLEEAAEESERQAMAGRSKEFMDPLLAQSLADASAGTISDRIHRKIGSVQRTHAALEKKFTRK